MYNRINKDLMTYRKAKDKAAVILLSTLKGELGRMCDGKPDTLTDDQVIKGIRKMVESIEDNAAHMTRIALEAASTTAIDLANIDTESLDKMRNEIRILNTYLPQLMDESQIRAIVENEIKTVEATSMKDMGKVMGRLKVHASVMNMKFASGVIKEMLS